MNLSFYHTNLMYNKTNILKSVLLSLNDTFPVDHLPPIFTPYIYLTHPSIRLDASTSNIGVADLSGEYQAILPLHNNTQIRAFTISAKHKSLFFAEGSTRLIYKFVKLLFCRFYMIEHGIPGDGSQILTVQRLISPVFTILIG